MEWPFKICDGPNCGETILFLKTESGKWIPVNPDQDGSFPDSADIFDHKRHSPHHATCVDRDQFKRGKK